ncbi:MAG: hypothetical protein WBP81_23680 [Solirubrobacteraceae bacterium]
MCQNESGSGCRQSRPGHLLEHGLCDLLGEPGGGRKGWDRREDEAGGAGVDELEQRLPHRVCGRGIGGVDEELLGAHDLSGGAADRGVLLGFKGSSQHPPCREELRWELDVGSQIEPLDP